MIQSYKTKVSLFTFGEKYELKEEKLEKSGEEDLEKEIVKRIDLMFEKF